MPAPKFQKREFYEQQEAAAAAENAAQNASDAPEAEPSVIDGDRVSVGGLTDALVSAIQLTKPRDKRTTENRRKNSPWDPKDGSPKLKLKRKFYQHSLLIPERMLTNERIALINQLRAGDYCQGWIKVRKRKDGGVDIDYPIKTVAQRMKLVSNFGLRDLTEILQHCVTEAEAKKARGIRVPAMDEVD